MPDPGSAPETKPIWDDPWLRHQVDARLREFLAEHAELLQGISGDTAPVSEALDGFLSGGKRMRGVLCYWGWRATGLDRSDQIVTAAASLEFLQAAALIHDDVMDDSDLRRGLPAIHQRFATIHRDAGWHGSAERFGESAAILLGDLCLVWADELLLTPRWDRTSERRAKPLYDLMRTELMVGQYLDVLEQARGTSDVSRALRVATFKSGRYSVERPLQLGAALAGADDALLAALGEYGNALGQAFQLRDDLLGVFGEPSATGKPAGDDLREGKRTVLVALALESCGPVEADLIESRLGDPDLTEAEIDQLRSIIDRSGAAGRVEQLITDLLAESIASLTDVSIPADVKDVLRALASSIAHRDA